ncbi:MAG: tRNA(Ile)-lysidine synthetase, partial [Ruminococcus sp.]|nr:tRNA(Ile)-lysidine synthetase [Ruminococcus sp.]
MTDKIFRHIKENNLLADGDTVVCGLSGGADSVGLLLALYELRERLSITVEALHVNHCLRGDESDRDEEFCRQLCGRLNIPFSAFRVDVK